MDKTISVWIMLKDGENKGKVALQKRSEQSEHFPLVCQATWAGKVEDGEEVEDAVRRECKEELGVVFFSITDFSKLKLLSENGFKFKGRNWTSYNYVGEADETTLKKAKLHEHALPEFVFADKNNVDTIPLFEDQREVLKNILHAN